MAYSPDGKHIVSGCADGIRVLNAKTGQLVGKLLHGHSSLVRSVAFSPDGKHIVSGSLDSTIRVWNASTGEQIGPSLLGHTSWIRSVTFSPSGEHNASAYRSPAVSSVVRAAVRFHK